MMTSTTAPCAGTDTTCTGIQGVEVFLQEFVGIDAKDGGMLIHLDGGGDFNPQQIPHRKVDGNCVPVYPHDFIKSNTIFEVVKQHIDGSYTAWADKHAWGTDWVNGPSGKGVDDMARTEINSLHGTAGNDYTGSSDGVAPAYLNTEVSLRPGLVHRIVAGPLRGLAALLVARRPACSHAGAF